MPLNHTSPYAELTEQQYAALGRIVVEWSNIERLLGFMLSRLLCTPEFLGRTFSQGLSAVRLQQAIDEAVEVHRVRYRAQRVPESTLQSIEALNSRVTALRAERNKISHFCWVRSNDEEMFGTAFAGGVPTPRRTRRTERSLNAKELTALHKEAYGLTEELMRVVESLPKVNE